MSRCWYGQAACLGAFATLLVTAASAQDSIAMPALAPRTLAVSDGVSAQLVGGRLCSWGDHVRYVPLVHEDPRPTCLDGFDDATEIAIGDGSVCVLRRSGAIDCVRAPDPVEARRRRSDRPVMTRMRVPAARSIAGGWGGACAVTRRGEVHCWGALGDEAGRRPANRAIRIRGIAHATAVAFAGLRGCAILADTSVRCFGDGSTMEFGTGAADERFYAMGDLAEPLGLGPTRALALANYGGCALSTEGVVRCWGEHAAIPSGSNATPTQIPTLDGSHWIAMAERSVVCGGAADGSVRCAGQSEAGLLGDGSRTATPTSVRATEFEGARELAVSRAHACLITSEGRTSCLGDGSDGATGRLPRRELVAEVPAVRASWVSAGRHWTCAGDAGGVHCWGMGDSAFETEEPFLVPLPDPASIRSVVRLGAGGCVLRARRVACYAELARPQSPVQLPVDEVDAIVAEDGHICARAASGIACFEPGGVSVPSTRGRVEPTWTDGIRCRIEGGAVICGRFVDIAVLMALSGEGHPDAPSDFVRLPAVDDAIAVAAGFEHACAVRASGAVACFTGTRGGGLGRLPASVSLRAIAVALPRP